MFSHNESSVIYKTLAQKAQWHRREMNKLKLKGQDYSMYKRDYQMCLTIMDKIVTETEERQKKSRWVQEELGALIPNILSPESRSAKSLSESKILIVDKMPLIQTTLKDALTELGYLIVDVTGSTAKAFNMMTKTAYNAVLCDIDMSENGSLDIVKAIKNSAAGENIIVIVTSPYATQHHALKSMEAGADHYRVKPLERDSLFEVLQSA